MFNKIIPLLLLSLFSCSKDGTGDKNTQAVPPGVLNLAPEDLKERVPEDLKKYEPVARKIQNVLDSMSTCDKDPEQELCKNVNITYQKPESKNSFKPKILLMTAEGIEWLALTRYKKRIADFVKPDNAGNWSSFTPTTEVPKALKVILGDILGEEEKHIPFDAFAAQKKQYYEKIHKFLADSVHHETTILNTLAQMNPETDIVIADHTIGISRASCLLFEDDGEKKFQIYAQNYITSFKKVLREQNVGFINASFGYTKRYINLVLNSCQKGVVTEKIFSEATVTLQNFFKEISSLNDVLFVQAGISQEEPLSKIDIEDRATDTQIYPSRVRIGFFQSFANSFPQIGKELDLNLLKRTSLQIHVKDYIDLFVNTGLVNYNAISDNPLKLTNNSIGSSVQDFMGTSFVTPLALSYFLHQKEIHPEIKTMPELLDHVLGKDRKRKMHDPLTNKTLEVYRLNYLK